MLVAQVEQDGVGEDTKGIVLKAVCNVEGIPTGTHSIKKVMTMPHYKTTGNLIGGVAKVPWDGDIAGSASTVFTSHLFADPIVIENLQLLAITVRITFD